MGYLISNPSFINAQEYDSWAIKTNERFTDLVMRLSNTFRSLPNSLIRVVGE